MKGDIMNKLQIKYNLLHIFYWVATCCIYGYVAVFLKYKGLTNTEIGLVTGGGCVVTIFSSPFVSSLVGKVKGLTIKKLVNSIFLVLSVIFMIISLFDIPVILIMIAYVLLIALIVSTVPLLSTIAMDYIKEGKEINFGLARGLGSVSYAVSAVVLGQLVEKLNPTVLAYGFVLSAVLDLVILNSLPAIHEVKQEQEEKGGNFFSIVKKYKTFFFILLGFACMFAASTSLSTYLINIVNKLGGNTSLYGIAIFFMAASEMPVMAITPRLLRRFDSLTLIVVAAIFYIFRNFTICLAPSLPILFIGMLFQGASYGLLTAVITYYVTYTLESQDHMMGQTMISVMTSGVGSMTGNLLGGVLQDNIGIQAMFIFACVMTVTGCLIIIFTKLISSKKVS